MVNKVIDLSFFFARMSVQEFKAFKKTARLMGRCGVPYDEAVNTLAYHMEIQRNKTLERKYATRLSA